MKMPVVQKSEEELLKTHPIWGRVPGWFFRMDETSNNVWVVEGVDCWGRTVAVQGSDPGNLLTEAESAAERIREDRGS